MKKINADFLKGGRYLPVWELNHSPRILVAYEQDFLNALPVFRAALPVDHPFVMLLQIGYSLEVPAVAEELRRKLAEARRLFPEARIIVLTNTAAELLCLPEDIEKYHCSQNAFLDPRRYPLATAVQRTYQAIYVARLTPFKRHELAVGISGLHLVGDWKESERDYAENVLKKFPHAHWDRKVAGRLIGRAMGQATCGLALSAEEGAMFVMSEYALCGLPVVDTPNVGGREELVPDFAIYHAEPTAESVAAGVEYWLQHPVEPQKIRNAFLEKAGIHRRRLQQLLSEIAGRELSLPHKLNIRSRLWPWQYWLHGVRHP